MINKTKRNHINTNLYDDIMTGQKLMSDGHRVRLATHTCFRAYVEKQGLEFYPLAGDPHLLSDFMVKTNGCLIPTTADLLREVLRSMASYRLYSVVLHHLVLPCVLLSRFFLHPD